MIVFGLGVCGGVWVCVRVCGVCVWVCVGGVGCVGVWVCGGGGCVGVCEI